MIKTWIVSVIVGIELNGLNRILSVNYKLFSAFCATEAVFRGSLSPTFGITHDVCAF